MNPARGSSRRIELRLTTVAMFAAVTILLVPQIGSAHTARFYTITWQRDLSVQWRFGNTYPTTPTFRSRIVDAMTNGTT
jgi:hypothetical protein